MRREIMEKRIRQAMAVVGALALMVTGSWDMPGRLTAVAAASTDTEESVGGDLMKGKFSSLTLYRWEKIKGDMPKFTEPTNVMFFQGNNYFAVDVPNSIYHSMVYNEDNWLEYYESLERNYYGAIIYPSSFNSVKPGEKSFAEMPTNLDGMSTIKAASGGNYTLYEEFSSFYMNDVMILKDSAVNYKQKDSMINTDKDVFFTDDNRDTPYIKYTNVYNNGEYDFFFTKDINNSKAVRYYISDGTHSKKIYNYENSDAVLNYMRVQYDKDSYSNLVIKNESGKYCISSAEKNWSASENYLFNCGYYVAVYDLSSRGMPPKYFSSAYKGEEMNFSKLNGNTTIGDGQVLTITKTGYLDSNGKEVSTSGCIIDRGQTLTINKGGVLSISGDLINNGTIINNGGTILIKDGGCISSFLAGSDVGKNGCGTLKCSKGDILIEKGGALYAGMNDSACNKVPFYLDNSSTLINCGLLVYGEMRLGEGARVECRPGSKTIGNCFGATLGSEEQVASLNSLAKADVAKLAEYKKEPDKYRIEEKYETLIRSRIKFYLVYLKPGLSQNDSDYDILSYYNDKILEATSGIPTDCKGIYRHEDFGGMYKSSSSAKTTVLKFSNATVEDKVATDNKLITTKDGL